MGFHTIQQGAVDCNLQSVKTSVDCHGLGKRSISRRVVLEHPNIDVDLGSERTVSSSFYKEAVQPYAHNPGSLGVQILGPMPVFPQLPNPQEGIGLFLLELRVCDHAVGK